MVELVGRTARQLAKLLQETAVRFSTNRKPLRMGEPCRRLHEAEDHKEYLRGKNYFAVSELLKISTVKQNFSKADRTWLSGIAKGNGRPRKSDTSARIPERNPRRRQDDGADGFADTIHRSRRGAGQYAAVRHCHT